MIISEKDLVKATEPYLVQEGYKYTFEVPLHNRVIDAAAIDKNGMLIGIEFKMANWKKAISQAITNANAFDYVYVCLPKRNRSNDFIVTAKKYGVGVMIFNTVDSKIDVCVKPKKIRNQWRPNLTYIRNHIMEDNK